MRAKKGNVRKNNKEKRAKRGEIDRKEREG